MYNATTIQASYAKLVGFLQPNDPATPVIPTGNNLLSSDSGVYLQNIHPLCTIDNLYYACPDFTPTKWPGWVSLQSYLIGAVVNWQNKTYKAKSDVTSNVNPATDTTNWDLYSPFLNWLVQLYNQACSNMIGEVIKRKKLLKMGKPLLEKQQLYRGYGQQNSTIVKMGRAVGFEIKPAAVDGLIMQIDAIGMQLSQDQTEINWYLYHSSKPNDCLGVFHLVNVGAQNFDWQGVTDCILGFKTQGSDTSGVFFLIYYENDLTGQAISKNWDFASTPCIGCDGVNAAMYNKWSRFTTIRVIEVAAAHLDPGRNLFDTNFISYSTNSNFGSNLSISVKCDMTDTLVENRLVVSDALAKQLALESLKFIAYSSRVNPLNDKINKMAMADLDPKVSGSFITDWNDAIDTVNLDFSGFSRSCMPEDNTAKIGWGSV